MKYEEWVIVFHMVWKVWLTYDKLQNLKGIIQIFSMIILNFYFVLRLCKGNYLQKISNCLEKLSANLPRNVKKIIKLRQILKFIWQISRKL